VPLPRRVAEIIESTICHRDPERYALLYELVWRIRHGEKTLPDIASDPLVHRLYRMEKSVRRDLHKMHAFVRFRRAETRDGDHFIAWFEPEHFILEATAQFFIDRFVSMRWSILTPLGSLHWDQDRLVVGPPASRSDVPRKRYVRGGLAQLLRKHLQSGAAQPHGDAQPHAQKILEEFAGSAVHSRADPIRADAR